MQPGNFFFFFNNETLIILKKLTPARSDDIITGEREIENYDDIAIQAETINCKYHMLAYPLFFKKNLTCSKLIALNVPVNTQEAITF